MLDTIHRRFLFDLMIMTDQGIRRQQNLAGRKLSRLVIDANAWTRIRRSKALVVAKVPSLHPGEYAEVEIPFP